MYTILYINVKIRDHYWQQLTCDWEPEVASYGKVRAVSVLHSGHSDVTLLLVWAWCSCVSRLLTIVTRTTIDKLLRMCL